MSFLSNIYAKLGLSSSPPKRPQHDGGPAAQCSQFTEEIDPEIDGFVLFTDQSKRSKTVSHESNGAIEEVGLQQATSAFHVSQRQTYSQGVLHSSVQDGFVTRGKPSFKQEDFLTVSGVPVQFSRKLQLLLALNSAKTEPRALNTKQYDYDFSLERSVLAMYDDRL